MGIGYLLDVEGATATRGRGGRRGARTETAALIG